MSQWRADLRGFAPFRWPAAFVIVGLALFSMRWGQSRLVAEFFESLVAAASYVLIPFGAGFLVWQLHKALQTRIPSEGARTLLGIILWAVLVGGLIWLVSQVPGVGGRLGAILELGADE